MTNYNNNNIVTSTTTTTTSNTATPTAFIPSNNSSNNISLNYKNHPSYTLFISSLKSEYTQIKYDGCLQRYLKHSCNKDIISLSDILSKEPKIIENEIIQQLIEMKKNNFSYSTMSVHIASLYHFFSINDIVLNRKKLSKFVGEQENKYEYRSYTREEISNLLSLCDERGKVIVLLMASTGMRVGALPEIKLKHLKRIKIDNNNNTYIYQIQVYAHSKKYAYKTFCTPECAQAIDRYLEYRKKIDKSISFDSHTDQWISSDPNTLLITRLFDIDNIPFCASNFKELSKKPMNAMGIRAYIVHRLKKLNLRQTWISTENFKHMSTHKNELHPCHSFRIFAITNMQRSKMDKTIREMIVGHSIGLDSVYFKPQDDEILHEFLKSVEALTINNENRLKKQFLESENKNKENEYYINGKLQEKDEEIKLLKQKFESDMTSFQEKMEKRMQELFLKVDVQKIK